MADDKLKTYYFKRNGDLHSTQLKPRPDVFFTEYTIYLDDGTTHTSGLMTSLIRAIIDGEEVQNCVLLSKEEFDEELNWLLIK